MFNIANHGKYIPTMRYHFTLIRTAINLEKQKLTSVGKNVQKLEPLCTVGGNVNWYNHYGEQYGGSLKI